MPSICYIKIEKLTLKKQISILLWLFGIGFLVMASLIINLRGPETTIKWGLSGAFIQHKNSKNVNIPILKDDRSAAAINVGSMLFISGKNLPPDSVVMLNNKMIDKSSYNIAANEGVYLKAPREGVFSLTVVNRHGTSNPVVFEVNNSINIRVLHNRLLDSYIDVAAWVNGVKVPLNDAGQGVAPNGLLKSGTVIVKGVSKKTGRVSVLSIADIDKNQKIEGVVLNPHSTAKYLIDKRLKELGLKATTNMPSDQQAIDIGRVDSYIRNMQESPDEYNLNSTGLNQEVTTAVRSIRSRRH